MQIVQTANPPLYETARLLGFGLEPFHRSAVFKIVKENDLFWIVEKKNGERMYFIRGFPVLSVAEAALVSGVLSEFQMSQDKKIGQRLPEFLDYYCGQHQIELESDQAEYLLTVLDKLAFGLGPMDELLKNEALEEIAITGIKSPVRVFDATWGWLSTNLFFENEKTVKNLVNKMARPLGRRLSLQTPRINAVLPDGSRLHAAVEPVSFSGPSVTIRKFRPNPFSPLDLVENKTVSLSACAWLWAALETDSSVLICGNTGSGKTTTLNALFSFVPQNERIIIVEETPEIRVPHVHHVRLTANEDAQVSMPSLILDSLRMRPDRVVIGEIRRQEEVHAFVDTLLAGQGKGSLASFHAQSAWEAVHRFKTLGVNEIDLASIGLIIVQRRWSTRTADGLRGQTRKITEICEVKEQNNSLLLSPVFGFDFEKNELVKKNNSVELEQKMALTLGISIGQLESELKRREKWLSKMRLSGASWRGFFEEVNRFV